MNISQLRDSKFLKRADVGAGMLVTIRELEHVNVAKDGAEPEMKWALHFDEQEKPMVLNGINTQIIAKIVGSEETDDWTGHKVVLYDDPNVSFGDKLVGGIRVRAPKGQAAKAAAAAKAAPRPVAPPAPADDESDIPY